MNNMVNGGKTTSKTTRNRVVKEAERVMKQKNVIPDEAII